MALALRPLNPFKLGFEDIVEEAPDSICDLMDYSRDYWMKKIKLSLWNEADLGMCTKNQVILPFVFMKPFDEKNFLPFAQTGIIVSISA
jgi:hypothetical protein